jgi:hypothetical protein
MDPNETLAQLRSNVAAALQLADDYEKDPDAISSEDGEAAVGLLDVIAQEFEALDRWLSRGGFRPRDWSAARTFSSQRVGQVEFDLLPNGLTHCPIGEPHTILLIDDHGHTDPGGPLWGMPEPTGWDDESTWDQPGHGVAGHVPESLEDLGLVHPAWEPVGPPNPAHADDSLVDQLDAELTRAGEIVKRMRERHVDRQQAAEEGR